MRLGWARAGSGPRSAARQRRGRGGTLGLQGRPGSVAGRRQAGRSGALRHAPCPSAARRAHAGGATPQAAALHCVPVTTPRADRLRPSLFSSLAPMWMNENRHLRMLRPPGKPAPHLELVCQAAEEAVAVGLYGLDPQSQRRQLAFQVIAAVVVRLAAAALQAYSCVELNRRRRGAGRGYGAWCRRAGAHVWRRAGGSNHVQACMVSLCEQPRTCCFFSFRCCRSSALLPPSLPPGGGALAPLAAFPLVDCCFLPMSLCLFLPAIESCSRLPARPSPRPGYGSFAVFQIRLTGPVASRLDRLKRGQRRLRRKLCRQPDLFVAPATLGGCYFAAEHFGARIR